MAESEKPAPGKPGIAPRWTTSSKDGVGGALNPASPLTFTLSHGVLNEVYYPREDRAAIRDFELLVTDGNDFFSEEKRDTASTTRQERPGVPAFTVTNTCDRYRIVKQIVSDPLRTTVLQRVTFTPLDAGSYTVHALLAPHLDNAGGGNTAWIGTYKGRPMLFARNGDVCLALAASVPWGKRSAGFVGISDGWQDLFTHHRMTWTYDYADEGNVALMAEIDPSVSGERTFDLALGFGATAAEAAHHAVSSLSAGWDEVHERYVAEWAEWQSGLLEVHDREHETGGMFRLSAQILRVHQSKRFPGAMMASLSIPWGNTKGDDEQSGYHLVWPRDLVESAGGLLALRSTEDVLRVLNYLVVTQEADGHWSQNMWVDGSPYWQGLQLDETALPILLIDLCLQEGALQDADVGRYWPTVRRALTFLLRQGIVTEQDRWEEQRGISVFTLATLVSGVLAGAKLAARMGEDSMATYCRQTADAWNEQLDYWLYATGNRVAAEHGVEGYYLRVNPTTTPAAALGETTLRVKNQPPDRQTMAIIDLVSIDPLALVRFGLRSATDPRIVNTVRVIDKLLRADTPNGPAWYRYVNDGYGEHADGSAYDGTGIGRPWPLLAAERAHYELAAGRPEEATKILRAVEAFSNYGLLPEQIWDAEPIPQYGLEPGKHSGSAMPLVWAHAEHIKLVRSLKAGRVFDLPKDSYRRYVGQGTRAAHGIWRPDLPVDQIAGGLTLRIETVDAATVRWTDDDWHTQHDQDTTDMGLGVHYTDLATAGRNGGTVIFTIRWHAGGAWSGRNYSVTLTPPD